MSLAPAERVRALNDRPVGAGGRFVLAWMTAFRRTRFNHALEHAAARARELRVPLLVLEALRVGYEHASPRLHTFVLQGMADNRRACARRGVTYHPYVEPRAGAGQGLLVALAREAALVVADDWPGFFHPAMLAAAARRIPVRLEAVDANGLLPLSVAGRSHATAYAFRRHLQKTLRPWLGRLPAAEALEGGGLRGAALPAEVSKRWPAAGDDLLAGAPEALARLPLAGTAAPVSLHGGPREGARVLERFLDARLARYGERNEPSVEAASGLSPWLHFGHVGPHEVVAEVLAREGWTPERLGERADGRREGWWGLTPEAEGFLDQIVTWRELGFAAARFGPPAASLAALPEWAQRTLADHAGDPRPVRYDLRALEQARTKDPLWNAAQRQLVRDGVLHNYMRMLWGKRILEWSPSPQAALDAMFLLNDRYALDGRDPNSASGITWVLGRYDRPWAPERPIFGTVRYMSSVNTARKLDVRAYLARYGPTPGDAGGAETPSLFPA